jgi:hypothetical protein
MHERIKKYTGREEGSLPEDDELIDFGRELFDALFQGDVKRLYDEARSRNPRRKLDLVFTSMVPWLAEKPWEFAYDSRRGTFLATEDVHFIRNALTAMPVDPVEQRRNRLRMLVAAAQPVGFGELSAAQEERIIRRGFQDLADAGAVDIDVLPQHPLRSSSRRSPSRNTRLCTSSVTVFSRTARASWSSKTSMVAT